MMKSFKLMLTALLMLGCTSAWAQEQNLDEMTDKQLSAHFAQRIDELKADIKTVNTYLKGDKNNVEYHKQLTTYKAELSTVKAKKKIVDNAVKARAKSDAAIAKAEKAIQKAEKLKQNATELAKRAETAAREALKVRN